MVKSIKATFNHVLHVSDSDSNLLSAQSCTDKGYVVTFNNDIPYIPEYKSIPK